MPYLVVMDGPQKGRRYAVTDSSTRIGRVAGNHIVLDNISISSGHAEVVKDKDGFRLRDLDSTNGTRVNGHRVTDTLLFRNDEILFGDLPVVFSGEDTPQRQAPLQPAAEEAAPQPLPVTRPAVVVASSASGKHPAASMPPDFRKRRDTRLLWIGVILLLLIGIGFGVWRFSHALFGKG
jgi:hypothetical protein